MNITLGSDSFSLALLHWNRTRHKTINKPLFIFLCIHRSSSPNRSLLIYSKGVPRLFYRLPSLRYGRTNRDRKINSPQRTQNTGISIQPSSGSSKNSRSRSPNEETDLSYFIRISPTF